MGPGCTADVRRGTSRTTASAASRATSGSTLVQVSAVIAIVECPSISDTTLRFAPPARASVAAPWRRGAVAQVVQSDRRQVGLLEQTREQSGDVVGHERGAVLGGEHQAGVGPRCAHCSRSSSWRTRCCLRTSTVVASRSTVRSPLSLLGSPVSRWAPSWRICRLTVSVAWSRSTSVHRRPTASPRRRPRKAMRCSRAWSRRSSAWSRNAPVCAGSQTAKATQQLP